MINEVRTGINGNRFLNGASNQPFLSPYACRQIQKHIIVPILKEGTLKEFHGLVKGIPLRVGRKEITCLRDLEKVLLWLAPVSPPFKFGQWRLAHGSGVGSQKFTTSRSSFVRFGETTIQCLHTTVPHLNEADLRKPADRPYTNGYFLDLTEQVRQYAAMITAARERRAHGDATDDDPTGYADMPHPDAYILIPDSDERLVLHGGLTENGRPAELARMRGDQLISLRTGEPIDESAVTPRFATDAEREEYQLSMARRRKGAPERVNHRCVDCNKEFKRPCDLTKHEKTHSRPWKCSDSTCKYFHEGWPTEKERDRHVNDKHKSGAIMFKCHFHPCPYESKRESNCKQHMEKAHGWAYVRSKNNGKIAKTLPNMKSPVSPGSNMFNMGLDGAMSPYARTHSRATSIDTTSVSSPYLGVTPGLYGGYANGYPVDQRQAPSPALTPSPHNLTIDTSTANASVPSSSYGTSNSDIDQPLFGDSFDWSNIDFGSDFTSMNIQLHTPATSIDSAGINNFPHTRNQSLSFAAPVKNHPNLSPGAQGGAMLYSPYEQPVAHDEGFHEFAMTEAGKPTSDFPLFDSRPASSLSQQSGMLFAGLPNFAASIWTQQPNQSFDADDVMQQ